MMAAHAAGQGRRLQRDRARLLGGGRAAGLGDPLALASAGSWPRPCLSAVDLGIRDEVTAGQLRQRLPADDRRPGRRLPVRVAGRDGRRARPGPARGRGRAGADAAGPRRARRRAPGAVAGAAPRRRAGRRLRRRSAGWRGSRRPSCASLIRQQDTCRAGAEDDAATSASTSQRLASPTVTVATPGRAGADRRRPRCGGRRRRARLPRQRRDARRSRRPAWVLLEVVGDDVVVSVRDDGPGHPGGPAGRGRGRGAAGCRGVDPRPGRRPRRDRAPRHRLLRHRVGAHGSAGTALTGRDVALPRSLDEPATRHAQQGQHQDDDRGPAHGLDERVARPHLVGGRHRRVEDGADEEDGELETEQRARPLGASSGRGPSTRMPAPGSRTRAARDPGGSRRRRRRR